VTDWQQLEQQREAEQCRLDACKNAQERNRVGQFATPFALAREITQYVKTLRVDTASADAAGQTPIRFLEPSLGTGAFYSALRTVFAPSEIERATGIELDPQFAHAASQLWSATGLQVVQGDFTALTPDSTFNLILANPPYVRHHHLAGEYKAVLQQNVEQQLGYHLNGLAGLYCYFMLLADRWLAEDGIGVWLVPSEFMDVNYGEALRRYLTERVTLLHVHRAQPKELQFKEALVSSAIIVYRKGRPLADHAVRFSLGGPLQAPIEEQSIPLERLATHRKWTQLATPIRSTHIASASNVCFGDLFEIKRGIATGANEFFTLSRVEARRRKLPEAYLHPLLPSSRYLVDPIIAADEDGYPQLPHQEVLLDCSLPLEQIKTRYPDLYAYLSEGEVRGLDKRYLATKRTPWYRQEQRPVAPFLCTYMGRELETRGPFRFFWNQSQALVTNVYLMLYPTAALAAALQTNKDLYAEVFQHLLAIDFMHLMNEGRVYGGSLYKLEPRELSRVVLPSLASLASTARQLSLF